MALVEQVVERLRETQEQINLLEGYLREAPQDFALAISLSSLRSMEEQLREEFDRVAQEQRVPVCRYRLFKEADGLYPVSALTDSLGRFQRLFSVVYDAIIYGKKQRSTVSQEIERATTLDFGYAFSGSLGVVMTMPRAVALFDEEQLDRAMKTVMEMARSTSSDQVHAYAAELGPAPVRSLYAWAQSHIKHEMGADIKWKEPGDAPRSLFAQVPDLRELERVILEVSDEATIVESLVGELVGANIKTHSFYLETDDGRKITGRMSDTIGEQYTVELPKRYTAVVKKTTRINYATEEEDARYFLESLS